MTDVAPGVAKTALKVIGKTASDISEAATNVTGDVKKTTALAFGNLQEAVATGVEKTHVALASRLSSAVGGFEEGFNRFGNATHSVANGTLQIITGTTHAIVYMGNKGVNNIKEDVALLAFKVGEAVYL